jgi:hypothetical protein
MSLVKSSAHRRREADEVTLSLLALVACLARELVGQLKHR